MVSGVLLLMTTWCRYLDYFWGPARLYTVAEGNQLQAQQYQQRMLSVDTLVKPSARLTRQAWNGWTLYSTLNGVACSN